MAGPAAARKGDTFRGVCNVCYGKPTVTGLISTGSPKLFFDKKAAARVTDTGVGSCGHTTTIVSGSSIYKADGHALARVGDAVAGQINGTIISGSPIIKIS